MNDLNLIDCVTLLTQAKTYQIDGTLYRFLHRSDSITHPQFWFRPLPRQRKTADLKLNRDKVLRKVYEIPALYRQHQAVVENGIIQQSLF